MPQFDEALSSATDAIGKQFSRISGGAGQEAGETATLRDLSLPPELGTSLSQLFEDLRYPLENEAIPERVGNDARTFTLARRSETDVRHLIHIPRDIIDSPNGQVPIASLAFAIPEGARAFVLSHENDSPNKEFWEKIEASWKKFDVAGTFVGWRDVTRDLEAKARDEQLVSIARIFELDANGAEPEGGAAPAPGAAPVPAAPVEASEPATPRRVFISYSWDSDDHMENVLKLAEWLVRAGVQTSIDKWADPTPPSWPIWCSDEIEKARFVVVVCTERYLARTKGEEPPGPTGQPVGLGVTWESQVITNEMYEAGRKKGQARKFIPVVFAEGDLEYMPVWLRGGNRYRLNIGDEWRSLYSELTSQRQHEPPPLGAIVKLDELEAPPALD